jgi:putative acetyltransferase
MTIELYNDDFKDQIIAIWEKSVRATHNFLKPADIDYYKKIVNTIDFNSFTVYCALTDDRRLIGFIGVSGSKIEMLFLDPKYIGQGVGKLLMVVAMTELKATEVDVNEGNINAVKFYTRFGFTTYERTPTDSEGKEYPILKMKLANVPPSN